MQLIKPAFTYITLYRLIFVPIVTTITHCFIQSLKQVAHLHITLVAMWETVISCATRGGQQYLTNRTGQSSHCDELIQENADYNKYWSRFNPQLTSLDWNLTPDIKYVINHWIDYRQGNDFFSGLCIRCYLKWSLKQRIHILPLSKCYLKVYSEYRLLYVSHACLSVKVVAAMCFHYFELTSFEETPAMFSCWWTRSSRPKTLK